MKTTPFQKKMFGSSRQRGSGQFTVLGIVAAFTGTPLTGGDPTEVTFTNTSTNATEYLWEKRLEPGDWASFDGDSGADNPIELFSGLGSWDVRLTATGPGGSNTMTRNDYSSITS